MGGDLKLSINAADVRYKKFEIMEHVLYLLSLEVAKDIFETLSRIPEIIGNDSDLKARRILECRGIYIGIDKKLSKSKYNKQTHVDFLSEYRDFLLKNDIANTPTAIQTRIDIMQKEIEEKSKEISESWSRIREHLKQPLNSARIDMIKISFDKIIEFVREIGYDKNEHEFMLEEYSKFLEEFGSKEEVDAIQTDFEIIRKGYDKKLFITAFSKYKKLLLELGFEDGAKFVQKQIDDLYKQDDELYNS